MGGAKIEWTVYCNKVKSEVSKLETEIAFAKLQIQLGSCCSRWGEGGERRSHMAARQRTMPGTVHGALHGATTYDPARRRTDRSRGETAAALAARACDCEQQGDGERRKCPPADSPGPKKPKTTQN